MPQDKVYIREGQSLFDVALQAYGAPEYVIQVMLDNGIEDIADAPSAGTEIIVEESSDAIVRHLKKMGHVPVTAPQPMEGINYWGIEENFIVQ